MKFTLKKSKQKTKQDCQKHQEEKLEKHVVEIHSKLENIILLQGQLQQKDTIIKQLHDENQKFKKREEEKFLKPLYKAIIQFIDTYKVLSKEYQSQPIEEIDTAKLLHLLYSIPKDLEILLSNIDVDTYQTKSGKKFDRKIHKIIQVINTDDKSLHRGIKESVKIGYKKGDAIIRPEHIALYKYIDSSKKRNNENK